MEQALSNQQTNVLDLNNIRLALLTFVHNDKEKIKEADVYLAECERNSMFYKELFFIFENDQVNFFLFTPHVYSSFL